MARMVGLMAL